MATFYPVSQRSYLFEDAPKRLLDALLASSRIETFMPSVDIIGAGDYVNELLLLVQGTAEVRSFFFLGPGFLTNPPPLLP